MPNIKSAVKRMHSNAKKAEVNSLVSGAMKTAIKKFEKDVKNGEKEAARNDLRSVTRALLDKGADPNAYSGRTLSNCIALGHTFIVKMLIRAGADVNKDFAYRLNKAIEKTDYEIKIKLYRK